MDQKLMATTNDQLGADAGKYLENLTPPSTSELKASKKPTVIGIYGVQGCGKSFMLKQLKKRLGEKDFGFYDGSEMIGKVAPGGLSAFKMMDEAQKAHWRGQAIVEIGKECQETGRAGLVAGHYMFWNEGEGPNVICTPQDLGTYTHIIYLAVDPTIITNQRLHDEERKNDRTAATAELLRVWQDEELMQVSVRCRSSSILFSSVKRLLETGSDTLVDDVVKRIEDFRGHSEEVNLDRAFARLDEIFETQSASLGGSGLRTERTLVLDADKTLAAQDTGKMLFEKEMFIRSAIQTRPSLKKVDLLKEIFSSPLGYSYMGFRQAMLTYEDCFDEEKFENLCRQVASEVDMYPEFISLLQLAADSQPLLGAIVITSGLRRVWEIVLKREGLSDSVHVIGGGRIADGFVVTADVKRQLVQRLRNVHGQFVLAFGDGPLDMGMLIKANEAVVVVGKKEARSRSMEGELNTAIGNGVLAATQMLLPDTVEPRLDIKKLPLFDMSSTAHMLLEGHHPLLTVLHATEKSAAKLLMTPMRDASLAGPPLREAHRAVGKYLAMEFLGDIIGLEEYLIPHVQAVPTSGYRIRHQKQTVIAALMRAGEPMAYGVNDVLPLAKFLHAREPEDVKLHHVDRMLNIILVDSVINNGTTVAKFVHHIRKLNFVIRIIVVAGVAQSQTAAREGALSKEIEKYGNISIVALRLSENKYSGKGTTDTGNRLFNTTDQD